MWLRNVFLQVLWIVQNIQAFVLISNICCLSEPLKGPPVTQTTPGERSVLVKWRPLDCDDSRGKVHHYIIEYQAHFSNGTKGMITLVCPFILINVMMMPGTLFKWHKRYDNPCLTIYFDKCDDDTSHTFQMATCMITFVCPFMLWMWLWFICISRS